MNRSRKSLDKAQRESIDPQLSIQNTQSQPANPADQQIAIGSIVDGQPTSSYFTGSEAATFLSRTQEVEELDKRFREAMEEEQYLEAERYVLQSLSIEQQIGDSARIAADYGNLGNVYIAMNQLEKAENSVKKGLALDEKAGREVSVAIHYYGLARIYKRRGDYDSAEEMARNSADLLERNRIYDYAETVRELLDTIRRSAPFYREKSEA
jgi:tetratricopeptide (TPR) repeat protein